MESKSTNLVEWAADMVKTVSAALPDIPTTEGIPDALPAQFSDRFVAREHPAIFEQRMSDSYTSCRIRDVYRDLGMFAFVAWNWVEPFVQWINGRKILEIAAGAGWLAKALRLRNVDIIATDNNDWNLDKRAQTHIEELSAQDAVHLYGKDVDILLMSWIPYGSNEDLLALKLFHELNPQGLVVYIGEGCGGCTGSQDFFNYYNTIEDDELFNAAAKQFRAWWAIHDYLMLGQYIDHSLHRSWDNNTEDNE